MSKTFSMKARKRTGTSSLDLTIPSAIVRKYAINNGDLFVLSVEKDGNIILKYEKIYPK